MRKNSLKAADPTGTDEASSSSVPMARPDLGEREIAAVLEVLRSEDRRLSLGGFLTDFERKVSQRVGARFGVGVSSGTAGLHLCMIAAGVKRGDLVITSPFSFVASANCILYERGVPVFVDVEEDTGNLDPALVAEAADDLRRARRRLPRRTGDARLGDLAAILPVHAFGEPADMDAILKVADDHRVPVVEDACEALGSEYRGRPVGNLGGDAAVFAFYPNKQITTGEGGLIVTDREDWARLFASLRNQGRDSFAESAWLEHDRLGYNYRLDEMSAALGCAQIGRLGELIRKRQRVAEWYRRGLEVLELIDPPRVTGSTTRMSWFVYVIRVKPPLTQSLVMAGLARRGIESRPYFTPIHLQPYYRDRFGYREGDFPVAEHLGRRSVAVPFFPTMTESQVARVCDALRHLEREHR